MGISGEVRRLVIYGWREAISYNERGSIGNQSKWSSFRIRALSKVRPEVQLMLVFGISGSDEPASWISACCETAVWAI